MDFREALKFLQTLQGESQKLVLTNIQKVINHFPCDLTHISFVQVAGTNGKGSTSAYLASVLRKAGYRVGLFTSPHLEDVRERIAVDGKYISQKEFADGMSEIRVLCEKLIKSKVIPNLPTFFEFLFLLCLLHFSRCKVKFGVMEVGLGGRLDATSTIVPRVSVITNVSKDHTQILGKTIQKIAVEKAGIIRTGIPVVCGCPTDGNAYKTIAKVAKERGAQILPVFAPPASLTWKSRGVTYACIYSDGKKKTEFSVAMAGEHQCGNAAIALRTLSVLKEQGVAIPARAISEGIRATRIRGRIEWIREGAGNPGIILDGGHNPEGIQALVTYLRQQPLKAPTLIFGVMADKDFKTMAKRIAPMAETVILTRPASPRALDPEKLVACFPGKKTIVEKSPRLAFDIAKTKKKDIIITGSLYLAGELRTMIFRRKNRGH